MRFDKRFLRENLGGLSLTLIGIMTLGLSLMLYQGHHLFPDFALAQGKGLDGPDIDILERQNQAYERIDKAVTPAIVAIQSTQVIKVQQSPFLNDPFFRQFFGNMFPQVPREQREHALGSGVIVSPDGYIVTNNHVIAKASEISVTLSDKRTFKGKVVGADPQTDVAVVKIEAMPAHRALWRFRPAQGGGHGHGVWEPLWPVLHRDARQRERLGPFRKGRSKSFRISSRPMPRSIPAIRAALW